MFHSTIHSQSLFLRSVHRLLVTANLVPHSPFLVTLMMEALHSSETSLVTRATRHTISEGGILPVYICCWSVFV
jgi:hypothetical protein